jgi:hypothetical protein
VVNGITDDVTRELAPEPATFVADIRKTYATPLVRPVTEAVRAVLTPSAKVDHVAPALDENSIM